MTNDERNPIDEARIALRAFRLRASLFVIVSSFVIRHSSFVVKTFRSISDWQPFPARSSRHRRLRWCAPRSSSGHFDFSPPRQRRGWHTGRRYLRSSSREGVTPARSAHLLTATQHKIALIRDLGVAHLLVLHFDLQFAATAPEELCGNWSSIRAR